MAGNKGNPNKMMIMKPFSTVKLRLQQVTCRILLAKLVTLL